jgi:hypothetical protein
VALVRAVAATCAPRRRRGADRAYRLQRDPTFRGGGFRTQFNETSLRMVASRPLGGIGIGQYYRTSALFLSPQMAWTYGHENAHNYLLQVAAELGAPGAGLFLVWTIGGLAIAARGLSQERDARLLGTVAGAAAFLATCVTGHPFLVDEAAFPFWLVFGLAVGLAESNRMNASAALEPARRATPWWVAAGAAAAGVAIAAGAVLSAERGAIRPPASAAVDGFYEWETAEDGKAFRWTRQYASVFVPADVKKVYIPMRMPSERPALSPVGVAIAVGGLPRGQSLVTKEWAYVEVPLPPPAPPVEFNRIDLRVERTWQPAIYVPGSADMRQIGVQVGECELVR